MLHVIDGFLDAKAEREKALAAKYETIEHNGLSYPGLSLVADDENLAKIAALLESPILSAEIMYRYYGSHMEQSTFIHSDVLIASYTGIVFLSEPKDRLDGVAFWEHGKYGWHRHPAPDVFEKSGQQDFPEFWRGIWEDGLDEKKWNMTHFVPMVPGRLVLFPGAMYHSRYPKERPADTVADARLIKVFFCR